MPLPWVRLDTSLPSNPKILALLQRKEGHRAAFAYICGLAYSGAHGLDGFLTKECVTFIHCRISDAQLLCQFGLWIPVTGGWQINGWTEFQQSNEETQRRRERAEAGAAARWNGHQAMTDAERAALYRKRKRDEDGAAL